LLPEWTVGKSRIFLLSPASSSGKRAALLFNARADFTLAQRVRSESGAPLGEVFSFLSGLYFRGKLAYARAFENPPSAVTSGIHIITPSDGLCSPDLMVTLEDLEAFAEVPIDADESLYRLPLERDAMAMAEKLGAECEVVLLGSVATGKYIDVLLPVLGDRLLFPQEFLGHGDMARGAMMLKRAAAGVELTYIPVSHPSRFRGSAKKATAKDPEERVERSG
jgi:hypothetical protein